MDLGFRMGLKPGAWPEIFDFCPGGQSCLASARCLCLQWHRVAKQQFRAGEEDGPKP